MPHPSCPLLTADTAASLLAAHQQGAQHWHGSLDLGRSQGQALLEDGCWHWQGHRYPYPQRCRERTVYWFDGQDWTPVSRYAGSLIKLVPTEWGVPTFEIDGIKMLPTSKQSPLEDARRKVALVQAQGKVVLDTCGGLGYFAACCLAATAPDSGRRSRQQGAGGDPQRPKNRLPNAFRPIPQEQIDWQGQQVSNLRPAVLETAALPTELYP